MTLKGAIILTIVISVLVSFVACLLGIKFGEEDKITRESIINFVVILAMSLGICIPLETNGYNRQYENVVYEIKSLKSEVGASGRFFLGSGHIETQAYYFFYVQYDKGYKLEKITTSNTYISALEESQYDTSVLTKKSNKGEWGSYYMIYIPQDYIIFEFSI